MAAGLVTVTFLDGLGNALTGRFWSSDGTTAGLLYPAPVQVDSAGVPVDWTANVPIIGPTAADAALTVAPVTTGGLAKTTNPTAVSDGDVVNALHDKLGKRIVVEAIRELKGYQFTTITSSTTRTAIVTAGAANVFNDLCGLVICNSSATDTEVLIEDGTADVMTFGVKAGATAGFSISAGSAWPQATAATAWNATCADSVASITVGALYVKNT